MVSKARVVIKMNVLLCQKQQRNSTTIIGEVRKKVMVVVGIITMRPVRGFFPFSVLDCSVQCSDDQYICGLAAGLGGTNIWLPDSVQHICNVIHASLGHSQV